MEEVNIVEFDGISYIEVDVIKIKDVDYAFLVNEENDTDILIRKLTTENDKTFYDPVESEEEIKLALAYFAKKHSDLLEDLFK